MKSHNRTFQIVKKNVPKRLVTDLYHNLLTMKWSRVLILFVGLFLVINSLFATLYWFGASGIANAEGSWAQCFTFSVQTLATIGYGHLAPLSGYVHFLVTLEAIIGLILTAIMAGFFFAKFSRPSANVEFTHHAVIAMFDGKLTFMFRMLNVRDNQLIDSVVHASFFKPIVTAENQNFRKFLKMELVRSHVPIFSMSMILMHVIDDNSPLKEFIQSNKFTSDVEILINAIGVDSTFGQTVHATQVYRNDDIHFNSYFKDMVFVEKDGTRVVDYLAFNEMI